MFNKTSKHCVAAEGAVHQSTGGPSQSDYRRVKVSHDSTDFPLCAFFRVQLLVADAEPTNAVGFKDFCASVTQTGKAKTSMHSCSYSYLC